MEPLTPVLTILSAMITPVVLISACATLIMSTSNWATRVEDRLREWSAEFASLAEAAPASAEATRERRAMIFDQLDLLTSRARLLQRCLSACYLALGLFIGTSVTIGLAGVAWMFGREYIVVSALPIVLSLVGAGWLFYGSFLLVAEARLALRTTDKEMDFLWREGTRYASPELLERRAQRRAQQRARLGWFDLRGKTREEEP